MGVKSKLKERDLVPGPCEYEPEKSMYTKLRNGPCFTVGHS